MKGFEHGGKWVFLLLFAMVLLGAVMWCPTKAGAGIPATDGLHEPGNAVYYWRTVFRLSDAERRFMKKQDIKRLYLRFFDVTQAVNRAVPNAIV